MARGDGGKGGKISFSHPKAYASLQLSENRYKINISYYMPMLGLYVSVQHILKIKKMLSI